MLAVLLSQLSNGLWCGRQAIVLHTVLQHGALPISYSRTTARDADVTSRVHAAGVQVLGILGRTLYDPAHGGKATLSISSWRSVLYTCRTNVFLCLIPRFFLRLSGISRLPSVVSRPQTYPTSEGTNIPILHTYETSCSPRCRSQRR